MATLSLAEPVNAPPAPLSPSSSRLTSLDAYRGFIMLILISHGFGLTSLQHYPSWNWLARQWDHAAWEGCNFWDLIQPAFTFMVGAAMPFALHRRESSGDRFPQLFRHVAWRAFALIVLSNFLSNFGSTNGLRLQFINVLCQIAFGYFLCFLITRLPLAGQIASGAALLGLSWGLFLLFPGPDGPFSQSGNIGQVIDKAILGYNYSGFYTTINFLGNAVTILAGCWAGRLLLQPLSHSYKLSVLAAMAAASFPIGLLLTPINPMVKRLWTASFTFFSAGWVLLMLIAFYWIIEVRGYRKWAFPFLVLGMNSIFIYSFSQILHGWLYRGLIPFTGGFRFLGDLAPIPQNIVTLAVMWSLTYWLYRRKIFLKI